MTVDLKYAMPSILNSNGNLRNDLVFTPKRLSSAFYKDEVQKFLNSDFYKLIQPYLPDRDVLTKEDTLYSDEPEYRIARAVVSEPETWAVCFEIKTQTSYGGEYKAVGVTNGKPVLTLKNLFGGEFNQEVVNFARQLIDFAELLPLIDYLGERIGSRSAVEALMTELDYIPFGVQSRSGGFRVRNTWVPTSADMIAAQQIHERLSPLGRGHESLAWAMVNGLSRGYDYSQMLSFMTNPKHRPSDFVHMSLRDDIRDVEMRYRVWLNDIDDELIAAVSD